MNERFKKVLVVSVLLVLMFSAGYAISQEFTKSPQITTPPPPLPPAQSSDTHVYGVVTGDIDLISFAEYPASGNSTAYFFFVSNGFYQGEVPPGTYAFVYYCQAGGSFTRNQIAIVSGEEFRLDVNGC